MALKLNIGGTIFQTSRSTLIKYDCMFRGMLESGIPLQTDETGSIFIDRDPTHFRYILNFMRDGTVELPENPKEIREILAEAEFYLCQELIDFCKNHELYEPYDPKKQHYRVAKNQIELMKIVMDATRDVLVIIIPRSFAYSSWNQEPMRRIVEKHREEVDIVITESTNKAPEYSWTFNYYPINSSEISLSSFPGSSSNSNLAFENLDEWLSRKFHFNEP